MIGLALAGVWFVGGLVVTFAGRRLRGRILGLALMATGATAVVAAGAPRPATGWIVVTPAAVTLLAMLAFARSLARRLTTDEGPDVAVDDDRW